MEVIVVASGPSLTVEQCEAIRGRKVLSVSDTYTLLPFARWHYAADFPWWQHHHRHVGIEKRYSCNASARQRFGLYNPGRVLGADSGARALCLASNLGATRIIMLGFDYQHTGGKTHFFGDHPWRNNAKGTAIWLRDLPKVVEVLTEQGVSLINCTPTTAIPAELIKRGDL